MSKAAKIGALVMASYGLIMLLIGLALGAVFL